jgi:hypothetical protein
LDVACSVPILSGSGSGDELGMAIGERFDHVARSG